MAILAAVVLFLAGLGSGATAAHLYRVRKAHRSPPPAVANPTLPAYGQRVDLLRRLTARLDLDPEQRNRIDHAIRESQERLRKLWEPVEPAAKEEVRLLRRRIEAELRPNQRERFESLLRDRPSRSPGDTPGWKRHDPANASTSRVQRLPVAVPGSNQPLPSPAPSR
jgi:hypothetical protein